MRTRLRAALAALAVWLAAAEAAACPGLASDCLLAEGRYRALTPGLAPRGVVLFLHGWGGAAEGALRQEHVVAPLLARGYAVVAPQGLPRRPGD